MCVRKFIWCNNQLNTMFERIKSWSLTASRGSILLKSEKDLF